METNPELVAKLIADGVYKETATSSDVISIYPIERVLWAGSTRFCKELVIAESAEFGKMLFMDGELQSTSADEAIYHEHLVHPAVIAYQSLYGKKALRVLVLGAGEGATVREFLKYPVDVIKEVIWNDIDLPAVTLCREHLQYVAKEDECVIYYTNQRCIQTYADANKLVCDETLPLFDIVICDLPDPVVGENAGLYSDAFWSKLYERMAPNGIIATHCGPLSPGSDGMESVNYVRAGLEKAGFQSDLVGKVAIPSFQSEWGYLVAAKHEGLLFDEGWLTALPPTCTILDADSLRNFFTLPRYYWASSQGGV